MALEKNVVCGLLWLVEVDDETRPFVVGASRDVHSFVENIGTFQLPWTGCDFVDEKESEEGRSGDAFGSRGGLMVRCKLVGLEVGVTSLSEVFGPLMGTEDIGVCGLYVRGEIVGWVCRPPWVLS